MLSAVAVPRLAVAAAEAVVSADAVGDPDSSRRVYATIVIFVAIGVGMIVLAVWLFRRTRPEPQLLAPLEVMDSRRWRKSEPAQRRRELDDKRPPDARPLRRAADPPEVDSEFAVPPPVRSFDDLAESVDDAPDTTEAVGPDLPIDPTPIGRDVLLLEEIAETDDGEDAATDDEEAAATDADEDADVVVDPAGLDDTVDARRSEDSSA